MQLKENFKLAKNTTSAGIIIKPTPEQIYCIKKLCENILQSVHNMWGTTKITSGLRNRRSYRALKHQGYPVSASSDHFAWSDVNPRGTGAADFVVFGADMKKVFHWIIDELYGHTGQIIYYPKKNIIHVSNHRNIIFTMKDERPEERRVMIYDHRRFMPYPRRPNRFWSR
jgi:hypothetical protein